MYGVLHFSPPLWSVALECSFHCHCVKMKHVVMVIDDSSLYLRLAPSCWSPLACVYEDVFTFHPAHVLPLNLDAWYSSKPGWKKKSLKKLVLVFDRISGTVFCWNSGRNIIERTAAECWAFVMTRMFFYCNLTSWSLSLTSLFSASRISVLRSLHTDFIELLCSVVPSNISLLNWTE